MTPAGDREAGVNPKLPRWLRQKYFWLIGVLLLGFALRVYGLGDVAIDNDESIDYTRWVSKSFQAIVIDDLVLNNQTLSHILARLSILTLGDTLFSLRWPALGLSVLGLALIYRVGRELFGSRVGLASALLLAISPYAIFFAHSFRGYSGVVSLPLLIFLLAWLARRTNQRRYWLALGIIIIGTLYTHLFTVFALANVILIMGLMGRRGWRWLPGLAVGLVIAGVALVGLYAPVWQKALQNAATSGDVSAAGVLWVQRPQVPASLWTNLLWFNGLEKGSFGPYGLYPFVGLVILGVWLGLGKKKGVELSILLAWALLPFLEIWLLQLTLTDFWARPQYLGYTLPSMLMLAALALAYLPDNLLARKWLPAGLSLMLALGMIIFWSLTLAEFYQNYAGGNWQLTGNFLRHHTMPADLIICQRYQHPWRDVDFDAEDHCTRTLNYQRQAGLATVSDVVTSHELVYKLLPGLNSGMVNRLGRVWLVVWDVPADVSLVGTDAPAAEFNRFGRSFVLRADRQPTYLANLAQALTVIRATVQPPDQQYLYSLLIAPLAAATNQADAAQAALLVARQNQPDHPDGLTQLQKTEQLVKALSGSAIEHPLAANFDGKILLQGYNLSPGEFTPGATLHLTLFWSVLNPMQEDYSVFLHLRDSGGRTIAQFDYQPLGAVYSTRFWQPGQSLNEAREFTLPADFPPGQYHLVMGFYNPQTQKRLPLLDDPSGENALLLTPLSVQ